MIRVRIPLNPTAISVKFTLEKTKMNKKRPGMAQLKKYCDEEAEIVVTIGKVVILYHPQSCVTFQLSAS